MSNQSEFESALWQACHVLFTHVGRAQAYENYISALVFTLVDTFPELREPLAEKFTDISDLHRPTIRDELTLNSYNETVKALTDHFKLMKGGGFFKDE